MDDLSRLASSGVVEEDACGPLILSGAERTDDAVSVASGSKERKKEPTRLRKDVANVRDEDGDKYRRKARSLPSPLRNEDDVLDLISSM